MAILSVNEVFTGEVGALPRIVRIVTNNTFSEITTANFLNEAKQMGYTFYENDMILCSYGSSSETSQWFTLAISGSTITMEPVAGDVDLPVVDGHFAIFDGTSGNLKDAGYLPSDNTKTRVVMANGTTTIGYMGVYSDIHGTISNGASIATNPGSVHAGLSGTAGNLTCYPSTANSGTFGLTATDNAGNFGIRITNSSHGQASTYAINDIGQASGWLMNCTHSTDPGSNLIYKDITVTAAALASGGSVILIDSSGSKQYKVRSLMLNAGGTNFSGGGGNRLGRITDGTTVYAGISAATMQALVNAPWQTSGGADLAMSASVAANTSTAAGADLVFIYTGGTTDYTTGSLVITVGVERVA